MHRLFIFNGWESRYSANVKRVLSRPENGEIVEIGQIFDLIDHLQREYTRKLLAAAPSFRMVRFPGRSAVATGYGGINNGVWPSASF